jgi:hypothetical protein
MARRTAAAPDYPLFQSKKGVFFGQDSGKNSEKVAAAAKRFIFLPHSRVAAREASRRSAKKAKPLYFDEVERLCFSPLSRIKRVSCVTYPRLGRLSS